MRIFLLSFFLSLFYLFIYCCSFSSCFFVFISLIIATCMTNFKLSQPFFFHQAYQTPSPTHALSCLNLDVT